MKIYELARDLSVDKEALLFLAQSQGIEAKTIAKVLSTDEEGLLMEAFEERGGVLECPIEKEDEEVRVSLPKEDQTQGASNVVYEKPTMKKKKLFEKKNKKQPQGAKIKKQSYERPQLPKAHSQKAVRLLLGGVVGGVLLLAVGSALAYSQTQASLKKEGRAIIDSGNRSVQKLSELSRQNDYQAQLFTEEFTRAYLNVSNKESEQVKQEKVLQSFYGKQPALLSQGVKRNPSRLKQVQLLSMTPKEARFIVSVSVDESSRVKGKQEVKTQTLKKVFVVPYGEVDGKYYVSSYPTLEDVPLDRAGDEAQHVELSASSAVSSDVEAELNTFVKNVLTAKSSTQKDLDLMASGLRVSSGEKLKSLDYTYFKETGASTYQAVVQASFSNGLGVVPENWVFTIEKTGKSYFAKDFSSTIQKSNLESTKNN